MNPRASFKDIGTKVIVPVRGKLLLIPVLVFSERIVGKGGEI